jgi:single-strand DNA-binding protein
MTIENNMTVIGNLTRDPELRYTTGGIPVCSFSLAYTPRRKDENGKWVDGDTSFFNCSVWRQYAENVAASLVKGMRVIAMGTMQQRNWETDDGQKRTSYDLVCDEVAPSLKWGTIAYEKIERESSGGGGSNHGRASANGSRGEVGTGGYSDPIYADEEPF